mmetsp:Transcript_26192/g.26079  ORF Transcript_26192/g.26079 Transcript_26192/m.26079 type:complete len:252 (+) Transcript_26192:21-776(+)
MQKVFKIERIDSNIEFKNRNKTALKRRRKTRNNKKSKPALSTSTLQKMIKKQTQLHNEEKELLQKRERSKLAVYERPIQDEETAKGTPEIEVKKDDITETIETNESLSLTNQIDEAPQEFNPMTLISPMDQGIIQSLQFNDFVSDDLLRIKENGPKNLLPPSTADIPEYCLVLDLDETLVHCSIAPFEGCDEVLNNIYISYRPYLLEFLERVSQFFEVVVFTASESPYANMVIDRFDPDQKYIHHRLYRES